VRRPPGWHVKVSTRGRSCRRYRPALTEPAAAIQHGERWMCAKSLTFFLFPYRRSVAKYNSARAYQRHSLLASRSSRRGESRGPENLAHWIKDSVGKSISASSSGLP
jgi:hypothetical protein